MGEKWPSQVHQFLEQRLCRMEHGTTTRSGLGMDMYADAAGRNDAAMPAGKVHLSVPPRQPVAKVLKFRNRTLASLLELCHWHGIVCLV